MSVTSKEVCLQRLAEEVYKMQKPHHTNSSEECSLEHFIERCGDIGPDGVFGNSNLYKVLSNYPKILRPLGYWMYRSFARAVATLSTKDAFVANGVCKGFILRRLPELITHVKKDVVYTNYLTIVHQIQALLEESLFAAALDAKQSCLCFLAVDTYETITLTKAETTTSEGYLKTFTDLEVFERLDLFHDTFDEYAKILKILHKTEVAAQLLRP